jgi:hypothetical protein
MVLGDGLPTVGQKVFQDGQRFAVAAQLHGVSVAQHLERTEEEHPQ